MNQKEGGGHTAAKEHQSVLGDHSSYSPGFSSNAADTTGSAADGSDPNTCPHCGQPLTGSGLEQFLGRLGITGEMVDQVKAQFENVDIQDYLSTAREYLKDGSSKAQTYAKENPGKVAAASAALALGAGLIWSSCQATQQLKDRSRQLELNLALRGRKFRLDEVLRELDVTV